MSYIFLRQVTCDHIFDTKQIMIKIIIRILQAIRVFIFPNIMFAASCFGISNGFTNIAGTIWSLVKSSIFYVLLKWSYCKRFVFIK